MARPRRTFLPGVSAHIIKRGNNRSPVFSRSDDYLRFLDLLRDAANRHSAAVHAYVLMTNHVHLIVTPATARSIPALMKSLGERYSGYFNRTYDRTGTPWSGRYKARLLTDERYWLTCLRYVEQNPVRARMVVSPAHYRWSSYQAHAHEATHDWLQAHPVFNALGRSASERSATYRRLCNAPVDGDEIRSLRRFIQPPVPAPGASRNEGSDPGV